MDALSVRRQALATLDRTRAVVWHSGAAWLDLAPLFGAGLAELERVLALEVIAAIADQKSSAEDA